MNRKIIMSLRVVKLCDENGKSSIAIEVPRFDGSNALKILQTFPDRDIESLASAAYDIIMENAMT